MRIARPLVTVVPVALLLAACGGGGPDVVEFTADYPSYRTSQEIIGAADVIVRGTAQGSEVMELAPEISTGDDPETNPQAGLTEEEASQVPPVVVTVSTVRVTEVIKGPVSQGELIEVSQLGGELAGIRYVDSGTTMLTSGEWSDYVLLLADHGPGSPFDLLNPQQALTGSRSAVN